MIYLMDENIFYFHFSLLLRELEVTKSDFASFRFRRFFLSFPPPIVLNLLSSLVDTFVDKGGLMGLILFSFFMWGGGGESFDLIFTYMLSFVFNICI